MTAHWYFESAPDVWTEITDRIGRVDWEVSERAEEGAADMSTLVIDDPDGDFDIRGRIYVYCEEDSSEADDDRLYGGIVVEQEIGRGGGEWLNPLGRVWTISLVDMNTNWGRRVMVGADTDRPAETDVERVQWLMTTTETNWATDRTTWISTADPKDMDANKYLGSTVAQIMDDCAQPAAGESGSKNWYTKLIRDENGDPQIIVWYGRDKLEVYDSPLSLSNDQADWDDDALEDGTSLVWPISMDTKLRRDPTRVYSGVYEEYDGGAVYRQDADTIAEFSPWDFVAPNLSVKSKAKAIARAEGYLDELDEQDEVIHTTVELPAAKATMIRAGMRLMFRATHLPGFIESFTWCRVLTCSVKPVAAGERYQLTLELSPVAPGPTVADAFAALLGSSSAITHHFTDPGDNPVGGSFEEPTIGDLRIVESANPYYSIEALAAMIVRIESRVEFFGVPAGPDTVTYTVTVNGDPVGSDTQTNSVGGLWAGNLDVDVSHIPLEAGDIVSFVYTTSESTGMQSSGFNATYLRVGRGTIVMNSSTFTWVGG